jgi:3',5'-cyclic AMP phosphodiesterase CpdA
MHHTRRTFLRLGLPALATAALSQRATAQATPTLSFGIITDPQYADLPPRGARNYRGSLEKLTTATAELNRRGVAFTLVLGDLIDRDFSSFQPVLQRLKLLTNPFHIVPGNHDFSVSDDEKSRILSNLGLSSAHRSITTPSWRLILIDGTEISTYRHPAEHSITAEANSRLQALKSAGAPNAQTWNGAIGDAQLAWLDKELTSARAAGQRAIVAGHFPILPATDPHCLWNAESVADTLRRHSHAAAYLCGHNHKGNYFKDRSFHHVNLKGMVENGDACAFSILHCYPDFITIEGFGPEPTRENLR